MPRNDSETEKDETNPTNAQILRAKPNPQPDAAKAQVRDEGKQRTGGEPTAEGGVASAQPPRSNTERNRVLDALKPETFAVNATNLADQENEALRQQQQAVGEVRLSDEGNRPAADQKEGTRQWYDTSGGDAVVYE